MSRIRILITLLCVCLVLSARAGELMHASDLQNLARLAQQKNIPLLIMFSQSDCPYCEFVRSDYLEPMLNNREITNKVLMAEIVTDGASLVKDFDGKLQQPGALGSRYKAGFSPTLVFLDPRGKPLTSSLVGVSSRDFYGGELDQRIDQAWQKLHP